MQLFITRRTLCGQEEESTERCAAIRRHINARSNSPVALKLFVKFGIKDVFLGSILSHMKWTPVIALGYAVSIRVHLNVNSGFDGIMP